MLPTLFLAFLAAAPSVTASPWPIVGSRPSKARRGVDEVYGGYNITAAALEIRDSISSPTCNKTASCQQVITVVVPRCLGLQGSAGCWCGLEDPIHYCAICMLSPTDNTTTAEQTQSATEGHMAFHEGCAAYAASLNASASMSMDGMTMDMGTSTVMPTSSMTDMSAATGTAATNNAGATHKHSNTGPIVGGVVGGILGALLIAVGGWLGWRYIQSKSNTEATPYSGGNDPQMAQHTPTPYYGPGTGGDVKNSMYFDSSQAPQTPGQQPMDLMANRLSYANSTIVYPSPQVGSPPQGGLFPGSASKDYDTSMFAALGQTTSPPSQYGGNSNSSGAASQGPLVLHGTGQTWTTNPVTPPPPFAPSTSPGLPPGAKGPDTGRAAGYTSGVPEAMTVESERR